MSDCECCQPQPVSGACGAVSVLFSIDIAASRAKVWKALTADIDRWWLDDFYCAPGSKKIIMELKPGGRVYETDGKGGGLVWYTITALQKGTSITMAGHFGPPFGGPVTTILTLKLEAKGAGTHLSVSDYLYGLVSPELSESMEAGWKRLFVDGLKAYIEKPARKARKPARSSR